MSQEYVQLSKRIDDFEQTACGKGNENANAINSATARVAANEARILALEDRLKTVWTAPIHALEERVYALEKRVNEKHPPACMCKLCIPESPKPLLRSILPHATIVPQDDPQGTLTRRIENLVIEVRRLRLEVESLRAEAMRPVVGPLVTKRDFDELKESHREALHDVLAECHLTCPEGEEAERSAIVEAVEQCIVDKLIPQLGMELEKRGIWAIPPGKKCVFSYEDAGEVKCEHQGEECENCPHEGAHERNMHCGMPCVDHKESKCKETR